MQDTKKLKKVFDQYEWLSWPLQTVLTRYDRMSSERQNFEWDWDMCDVQFMANTFEDPVTWELIVNCNIEQQLQDIELGRTSADLVFDVKPAGYRVNTQNLESAKYILQSFIDKENFYDEYRTFKATKSLYWTGVWFTGLRFEIEYNQEYAKDDIEAQIGNWFFNNKFNEVRKEIRQFSPQNVPLRSFLVDDRVIRQNNFQKAEDCILIETLSPAQAQAKYGDVKQFNKKALESAPMGEDSPAYWIPSPKGMMIFYHYYNRTTKDYIIVVNRKELGYQGKIVYKNGKLPFDMCQHYPNAWCLYGIGIAQRVRLWKAYKNNIAQSALRSTRLSSGKMIALGNGWEVVDGDFFVPWGWIGIARLTNSVADMRDIDTRTDINGQVNMMSIIDSEIREATGLDIKAPFENSDSTLWQTEIREQNKAIRYKAVDELMQQSLDRVLTAMLNNIAQFAPVLLQTISKVKSPEGEEISETVQYPSIQINNVSIIKKKWVTIIKEDMGNFWYLELKPDTLEWEMNVNITTPATNNTVMQTIEKNKIPEMMGNMWELANVYWAEAVAEAFPIDQVVDKIRQAYWYDSTRLTADTKKDLIKKENLEEIEEMQSMINDQQSLLATQEPNGWQVPEMPTGESWTPSPTGIPTRQTEGLWQVPSVL